jgi:hypothetical protein
MGHLADPVLVDTDNLLVIVRSKTEEGNKVEDPTDGGSHDEGVGGTGNGIGELVTDLNPVLVKPSTSDFGSVEGRLKRKGEGNVSGSVRNGDGFKAMDYLRSKQIRTRRSWRNQRHHRHREGRRHRGIHRLG